MSQEWPNVSILIATKNRREDLKRAVVSIQELDYPKDMIEIVVVEETNNPRPIPGTQYYPIPELNLGFGYARNQCVKRARYSLLAFTDDDCLVEPQWLKELVQNLPPEGGGIAGAVKVKDFSLLGFCESVLGFPGGGLKYIWRSKGKVVPTRHLSTCNCLYRKKVFDDIGLFKENTRFSGEDYDFGIRVSKKYPCFYNPDAVIYHRPRGKVPEIFKWFIRRGRSEVNMIHLKTHPMTWQVLYIIYTSLFVRLSAAVLLFYLLNIPVYLGVLAVMALYYGLNLSRTAFQFRFGGNWKTWLLTPWVKLVMDAGMEMGKFQGLLKYLVPRKGPA